MKARVGRLQGAIEHFGDLFHGEALNLVEHEDRSLVLVEQIEREVERRTCLEPPDAIDLSRRRPFRRAVGDELPADVGAPTMVRRGALTDAVEPCSKR